MNTFELSLDLDKSYTGEPVRLRQGDKRGTVIRATIYDHGEPFTGSYTARYVQAIAGTGNEYYRADATFAAGVATVTVNEEYAAAVAGSTYGYFQFVSGSTVIASTQSFPVIVLPDATAEAEVGERYDSAIEYALAELDEATGRISQMVQDATAEYLEAHPEITTTVQDNSLDDDKLIQKGGILQREQWLETMLPNIPRKATSEADVHSVTDSAGGGPLGIEVYGRSTQDGTPTPDAPVAIVSVGTNLYDHTKETGRTNNGVTWTVTEDGIHASGTASGISYFKGNASGIADPTMTHLDAGTYTIVNPDGALFAAWAYDSDGNYTVVANWIVSNAFTLTVAEESWLYFNLRVASGTTVDKTYRIGVFEGAGHVGYAPFECVDLDCGGRNQFAGPVVGYSLSTSTGKWSFTNNNNFVSNPIAATGSTLTLVVEDKGNYAGSFAFACYGASGNFLGTVGTQYFDSITVPYRATITLKAGTASVRAYGYSGGGARALYNAKVAVYDGSVSDAYMPYESVTIPIDLGGRSLRSLPDGTRDEVTVDEWGHAILTQRVGAMTLNGSESWGSATNRFVLTVANLKPAGANNVVANGYMSRYVAETDVQGWQGNVGFNFGPTNQQVFIAPGSEMHQAGATAFKAWLAENPVDFIYPLAEPVTIDLGHLDPALLPAPDLTAYVVPSAPSVLRYGFDVAAALAEIATN